MDKFENKSLSPSNFQRIGIMGGMYNPVHNAHLRVAIECQEKFNFDELKMLPCAVPPHRDSPEVDSQQRCEMLRLALSDVDNISVDTRELDRSGMSYTVDTLRSLKIDFPDVKLFLIVGSDAFQGLNTWHKWKEILQLSNIVIAQRPDNENNLKSEVGQQLKECFTKDIDAFLDSDAGQVFSLVVSQMEISSSQIRELIGKNMSAQFLVPDVVLDFIKEYKLYK